MTGLLILKHLRNISDEQVVAQFRENAYYQYFCGMKDFTIAPPCASSELAHFRNRIGEAGVELILKESIRVNLLLSARKKAEDDGRKPAEEQTAFIDSTVQEKNVTFPADSKLLVKIIGQTAGCAPLPAVWSGSSCTSCPSAMPTRISWNCS